MFTFQAKLNRSSHGSSGGYELKAPCALSRHRFRPALRRSSPPKQPAHGQVGVIREARLAKQSRSWTSRPRTTSSPARAWRWTTTTPRPLPCSTIPARSSTPVRPGDDPVRPLKTVLADGVRFFIVDLPAAEVLAVADAARPSARSVESRRGGRSTAQEDCRANVIHVAPTRSMLTDGLAQYLISKQSRRLAPHDRIPPRGQLLAEAHRRSARNSARRSSRSAYYQDTSEAGARTRSVQVQRQMPVFTQMLRVRRADRRRRKRGTSPAICPIAPGILDHQATGLRPVSGTPRTALGDVQIQTTSSASSSENDSATIRLRSPCA